MKKAIFFAWLLLAAQLLAAQSPRPALRLSPDPTTAWPISGLYCHDGQEHVEHAREAYARAAVVNFSTALIITTPKQNVCEEAQYRQF